MSRNIIDAIITIIQQPSHKLVKYTSSGRNTNRMNVMGDPLEEYVKNMFADTFGVTDPIDRMKSISQTFSYLGNDSTPPDGMLKGGNMGDAIEVKKTNSFGGIQLNSSHPKSKLLSTSTMITNECRTCEDWTERDMIYVMGQVSNDSVKTLCMVYGMDYCANNSVYESLKDKVTNGIRNIPDIRWADRTEELGRVNMVDPLGITYLRVRGMWFIQHPIRVFDYIYDLDKSKEFNLMVLINEDKISQFNNFEKLVDMIQTYPSLEIKDVQIKNPNNPAQLRNAKLITYSK
ncbi:MAG: NgoPII family restriction endonuclease [Bacteroidales bacterium]|nr:NgoPII family restriction endonuclease [Bacteroidales bacterium]